MASVHCGVPVHIMIQKRISNEVDQVIADRVLEHISSMQWLTLSSVSSHEVWGLPYQFAVAIDVSNVCADDQETEPNYDQHHHQ